MKPTDSEALSPDTASSIVSLNVREAWRIVDELASSVDSVLASSDYIHHLYSTLFEHSLVTGVPSVSSRLNIPIRYYEDMEMLTNACKSLEHWIADAGSIKALDDVWEDCGPWSFLDMMLCPFCQVRLSMHGFLEHLPSCVCPVIEEIPLCERKNFEIVLCGHINSTSGASCRHFRAVCREHRHINFPSSLDGTQICGYPYVFHAFLHPFSESHACLLPCSKCSRHWGWQQALRALLDSVVCVTLTGLLAAKHVAILEKLQLRLSHRLRCLTNTSRTADIINREL
ncbi:zf-CpG bind C domain containing protein [Trichuris trichiura]|uniref:Zf-CpG bind C domain containing protein n=1 Tax=Trichuris trichiura TaxID=36087 RepID=A0A077ZJ56_TRITR|nr:zf-CpG bind C domain containing protein [Trichuris trichiura]